MKEKRKYLGVPTIEEIKEQYNEILELTKDVTTFEQIKDFMKKNAGVIDIEVNGDVLSEYKGEEIEDIRYEYKNILVYRHFINGKDIYSNAITLYDDEGEQVTDSFINKIESDIELVAKRGLLKLNPEFNKFKVALHHVELEKGIGKTQILDLIDKLIEDDKGYMPIEFHTNNSSAYGFISSTYYEELNYDNSNISKIIEPILEDWNNEREDKIYTLEDKTEVYMDCDYKTI